ncbi:MAG: GNAT family N-acetyltransferase [Clostridia bacterium]|nr:GNAT family N-acetyltransferase [Clostridia bacterium]
MHYHRTTEDEKHIISAWRYEGEYAIYDNIPYDEQKRLGRGFANPRNNFFSFYDGERIIGFVNLIDEGREVFFGIGVSPELCGQGYGQRMARAACGIASELFGEKPLYLEVRTWNSRAVRCYEKAGFRIVGTPFEQITGGGAGTFYRMIQGKACDAAFWEASWEGIEAARVSAYLEQFDMSSDRIIQYLKAQGAASVCDAGCGCGVFSLKLALHGFSVSGFDLSDAAVRLTRDLLKSKGYPSDGFRAADVLDTKYADGFFDAVISRDVLDHMPIRDATAAADELLRITRPGGCVLLTLDGTDDEYEAQPHERNADGDYLFTDGKWKGMVFHPYSPDEVKRLLPHGGFEIIDFSADGLTVIIKKQPA